MHSVVDTYYHMLENPRPRSLSACSEKHQHVSTSFQQDVYEASRQMKFPSLDDAYDDWVMQGRKLGLAFAEGKNTLLKIILKVKDEPFLLPIWIDYYESIVGMHNIVIVDCGSTDPVHLSILESLAGRALVLRYDGYYDGLHDVKGSQPFYDLMSLNARFIAVLDADEFIFGHRDGLIGRHLVVETLRDSREKAFAGTWFPNIVPPAVSPDGRFDDAAIPFNIEQHILKHGTVAGKSIIRTDAMSSVQNIGHNLHVKSTVDLFDPGSFGRIGVLHVSKLGLELTRPRVLKHLRAKGIVKPGVVGDVAVSAELETLLSRRSISGVEQLYAKRFLGQASAEDSASESFATRIITDPRPESVPEFSKRVDAFDFMAVRSEYREGMSPHYRQEGA